MIKATIEELGCRLEEISISGEKRPAILLGAGSFWRI